MGKIILAITIIAFTAICYAGDWNSNPNNWKNSPNNWENSSSNWENSPNNWDNSPNKYGNSRIIRDSDGNAIGYAVPKQDGGVNYFDFNGDRRGYRPGLVYGTGSLAR